MDYNNITINIQVDSSLSKNQALIVKLPMTSQLRHVNTKECIAMQTN